MKNEIDYTKLSPFSALKFNPQTQTYFDPELNEEFTSEAHRNSRIEYRKEIAQRNQEKTTAENVEQPTSKPVTKSVKQTATQRKKVAPVSPNDADLAEEARRAIKKIESEMSQPSEFLQENCKEFAPLLPKLTQFKTPEQAKALAVAALLENIGNVNLKQVCKDLGWIESDESHYPKQKHIKVAIVDTLIKTAKKHNWHIIHNEGFFYIFNGAFWVALQDSEVKQLLKNAAIKMEYLEIECRDVLFVDKLFQQATQDGFFAERNLKKQSIINLKNGSLVLDERGATLKPFDYRDFLTHQLDFDHAPVAVNHLFQEYLDDVLPNKDTQKTLQQVAGYLFIKGLKLELTFFLYGTGANGKSVFFEIINGVIGSENISNYSLESLTDEKGYHRAMIKDKIVNYGTDIRLTKIDAGMFKTLSSGEPIDARLPYRDPFTMTDYAKLIFNVNKMDSANVEHTHGFFRRFLIIPFNETIPDAMQDKDLHKKILTNRAGVLNWMIEGAKEVVKNRKIFVSAECEQFKKQLMKETDSVAMFEEQFIKENLRGTFYICKVVECYNDYKSYCVDVGFRGILSRGNFVKRMEVIGFDKFVDREGTQLKKSYTVLAEKF